MALKKIKLEVLNVGVTGEFEDSDEILILLQKVLENPEVKHYLMTGTPKPTSEVDEEVEPLSLEMPELNKRNTYFG